MSTQICTGIIVGGGSDNNDTNNSENRGVIERHIPPRWVIATFGIMSVCYTIWFVVELIWVGNQNAWQFYMPGLMMEIDLVLVLLIVLVLSVIGLWPQICCCSGDEMNSARIALYCASISLGLVAAGFYFYLYVPLQSSLYVWIIRWVPLWRVAPRSVARDDPPNNPLWKPTTSCWIQILRKAIVNLEKVTYD